MPPAAYRRQLKTEAGSKNKFVPGIGQKDDGRGQNKIRGNTRHSDGEFW
jgi:hypothetical protein